jgi:pilus assembly protein CpaD
MRSLHLVLTLSACVAAAGCAPVGAPLSRQHNPSVYSVHQPVVQRTDYVLDLAAGGGLPQAERARLDGWFASLQLRYGDRIWVDEGPYADPRTRGDVAAVAAPYGLLLSDGAPVTGGTMQPGSVRVIVSRMSANVPGCPSWDDAGSPGGPLSTHGNYGCATNTNLAAMIADPNDLVLGQADASGTDAATASKAVKAYRDRVPSGASGKVQAESTGGK